MNLQKMLLKSLSVTVHLAGYFIGFLALAFGISTVFLDTGENVTSKEYLGLLVAALGLLLFRGSLSSDHVTRELQRVDVRLEDIDSPSRAVSILRKHMNQELGHPRALSKWIGEYYLNKVENIIQKDRFDVKGGYLFRDFYIKAFEELKPPCDLIASALPTRNYFWKNKDVLDAFKKFKDLGGTLTRVFLIDEEDDLKNDEIYQVMKEQYDVGIDVRYLSKQAFSRWELLMVDKKGTISWKVEVTPEGDIASTDVDWNRDKVDERKNTLEKMLNHYECRAFRGS